MEKEYTSEFGRMDDADFDFEAFFARRRLADAPSLGSSFMDCSPKFQGHVLDSNQVSAIKGYLKEMSYMTDDETVSETGMADAADDEMYEECDNEEGDDNDDNTDGWQRPIEEIDDRYSRMADAAEIEIYGSRIQVTELNDEDYLNSMADYIAAMEKIVVEADKTAAEIDGDLDNVDEHKVAIRKHHKRSTTVTNRLNAMLRTYRNDMQTAFDIFCFEIKNGSTGHQSWKQNRSAQYR